MGNNNVIGQQVSEEGSKDFDKTMHPSDCSPGINNINDKEKNDTKDVDMSEVLKIPLISAGGDEKMASDQTKKYDANEDLDEKNMRSLQDHSSLQDVHGNSNLHTEEGDETQDSETEIITNSTEAVAPVGSAIEDMTRNKDTSSSDEQFKQLVHESVEEVEESTLANPPTFLEENIGSLPKDDEESCSQEVAVVGGNLVRENTVGNLEVEARVSIVYDLSTPSSVQGETKSSTESILTDYRDAETKEVFIQDEPREKGNPSYVRPEDDTKQETSKSEEKQDIFEMGKSKSCKTGMDTVDAQEIMNNSQCDEPQQVLLEKPAIVKFETSETLSTFKQMLECSSATETSFANVFNKESEGASEKATCFTSESNEQKFTGTVGFATEFKEKKVIADADKSSEEQRTLQEPTLGRDAGEETPLLMSAESINSSSYSSEQHIKLVKVVQAKDEAVEESEKSPLLSPREPSEGAFRTSNQSARNNKPLHSLITEDRVAMWSPLKEQETAPKNSSTVSSPRSKEKQKPKSSLFAICMCCTALRTDVWPHVVCVPRCLVVVTIFCSRFDA